jgi:hypothetical protein
MLIIPSSSGSQLDGDLHQHTVPHQDLFLAPLLGKKKTFARGVLHAHPLLYWDFYFRALRSLVVLSFPQPLSFSSVFPSL